MITRAALVMEELNVDETSDRALEVREVVRDVVMNENYSFMIDAYRPRYFFWEVGPSSFSFVVLARGESIAM